MKFIVDGMLGKITRWLRMLGHNVMYSNDLDDVELITIAKRERRVLLTRDLELYQQAISNQAEAFYPTGETEEEKLAQLAKRFKIRLCIKMETSRCPKCNARVKPITKEEVASRIEKNTFVHYSDFWECRKCGQIYWQGAHWRRIRKTLGMAKEILKKG